MVNNYTLKRPVERKVRFSEKENQFINKKIEESLFPNFQNFALHMLIQGEVRHVDYTELKNLTTEVRRIGININQIVKLSNQFNEISTEDIINLQNELVNLTTTLQSQLTKLVKQKEHY